MPTEFLDIINKRGLHARAAAKLATQANKYVSTIHIRVGEGNWADAKSVMGLMLLAAGVGTRIEVRCEGKDEDTALDTIRTLVADRFGEEE